ncbi:MAG TPA: asparagine synthase-related protein [Azonexus sp.]|nr:asparagine synthase-related protein [Azonexus sp.]
MNMNRELSVISALSLGKPRFKDGSLAEVAGQKGDVAGWEKAFREKGMFAPAAVAGDFAVGLSDVGGRTFLAVDRFAVRSLCYRQVGDQLRFAERADELTDASVEIDSQAIFDYLYFHAIPSPRTIYKGIFRVPPGHCVLFENGQTKVQPYWIPEFVENTAPSFEELRTEFRRLLQTAVARQLDGGKAGCFLSGGTDSSTVAGMIGRARSTPAATYSIGFEAEGYDEMEFARIAAKKFGTEHHEYYVTPSDLVTSIPMVAASYDQPFGNSSALPAYYCARMAREDGLTTILAGDGGDELFGGNSRYARQKIFDRYQYLPGVIRRGILEPVFKGRGESSIGLIRKAASYTEQASAPMPDRLQMYNLITRLGPAQALTAELLAQVDISLPLAHQREVWRSAKAKTKTNRELAFDWRYTLGEIDLPKVTGTTRLAGIKVGFPMLDDDLVDFSIGLPTDYKLRGMELRWFFKEALRGFLPDEIIVKKKQGFGLPFGVWLTKNPALFELAADSVRGLAGRGILRSEFAETLLTRLLNEHPGYYGEMIWISMMLEQWLRAKAPHFKV